jgi:hypothetical protein
MTVPLRDPLAGSAAADRLEDLTVVLAGGQGVAMTALVGLPTSDLFAGRTGECEE